MDKTYTRHAFIITVGITILGLLLLETCASAAIITVPDDYAKIQDAVNYATAGDTIEVHSGTYYENVNVNKQLTLRGVGMPVVDAREIGSAFTLAADGIILEGFKAIRAGASPNAGIKVTSSSNTLSGNNATNNNNDMTYASYGIYLLYSNNNTLSWNNASNNLNGFGIYLRYSYNNTLSGNNASKNYYGITLSSSNNNTLSGNNASNNNGGYYGAYGIYVADSYNNTLSGNNANSNRNDGIFLGSSSNNTFSGNNASNNENGIKLDSSSNNNTLIGNYANSNRNYGIWLWSSHNNKIYNNFFNNTNNFYFSTSNINTWNITKESGTNIIGGSYLGGNVWAKPDGSGISQTCVDRDGICNSPYVLGDYNIDYLPLSLNFTDTTAPDSITNLANITYASTYINWTWTDPSNPDFNKVMIYINGTFKINVTNGTQYYHATPLIPNTTYDIGTRTVDFAGNINETWVNRSAITAPLPVIRFINGTVIDSINKTSISGVTVSANLTLSTMSDATGFYSFAVTDGSYDLISTYDIRYYTNTTSVSTEGKAVVILDIEMMKKPTGNITGSVTS